MSFNHLFLCGSLILLPLLATGQRSIEEFNWKKHSGWPPLTRIADHQLPPLFHSPSIQCILKCISQISCAAVCVQSESRCRLYRCADCAGGDKTDARFAEQTAICFVNVGSDKYLYRKNRNKNSPVDQSAVTKDLIVNSVKESVTQASLSAKITQMSREQDKQRMDAENAAKCNQGWKMFHTRRGIIQCRPILSSQPTFPTRGEEREDRMTRILMWPRLNHRQQGRQLYLNNNSVVEDPFWPNIFILAVAYISSQRKLVVSSQSPKLLFFTPIDEEKKTIIKKEIRILGITVDDHKQLVFLKVKHPEPCVCVMSADGKNITTLFSLRLKIMHPGGLVADPKRSLIYISRPMDTMVQFTYQGVSKGNVVGSEIGYGICIDMQGEFLYYQDQNDNFQKMSLSDHSLTTISTSKIPRIETMLTVGNILYMSSIHYKGDLLVINMSDMGNVIKISIDCKAQIVMCLIP